MVVMEANSTEGYVLMADLNSDGAMIQCSNPLVKGEEVTLQILDHKVSAKVTWERDGEVGLSFDGSISPDTISALNKTGDSWIIY